MKRYKVCLQGLAGAQTHVVVEAETREKAAEIGEGLQGLDWELDRYSVVDVLSSDVEECDGDCDEPAASETNHAG